MAKQLSIMRHAKSSWDDLSLDDSQRPILPKGVKRTKRVARKMVSEQLIPDEIWTSPAKRASETAHIFSKELKISFDIRTVPNLYEHSVEGITQDVLKCSNKKNHLLLVGHNPCFSQLVNTLAKQLVIEWLPTSALVTLEFETNDWKQILGANVNVMNVLLPKVLKDKPDSIK
jgi:phosphohistidine phosphatase